MTHSLFDPQAFLESTEIQGAMDTRRALLPAGRYNMQVEKYQARQVSPEGKDPFYTLEFTMVVDGSSLDASGKPVKDTTGLDQNRVRFSGYLDMTPNGALDLGPGKNITLGQIRAAAGLNDPSRPFKMQDLVGQVVSGEVYHRQDRNKPDTSYAEVKGLMAL